MRDSFVAEALNDATKALMEAVEKASSSKKSEISERTEEILLVAMQPSDATINAMDPDDLANAFFAKQEKSLLLPVDEWAKMIVLQRDEQSSMTNDTRNVDDDASVSLRQVNSLYQGFQDAIAE
jgi:hypothetical protein